jgi:hypothetical protein
MRPRIFLSLIAVCAVVSSAQTITLTAEKEVYLEDDVRAFHEAIFAPSGERVVLNAVIEGLDWTDPGCPLLTQIVRFPDGSKREYELGLGARCFQDPTGRTEVKFDAGHVSYWYGLGEYHIRLVLGGRHRDPNKTFPISNEITLKMADAATIEQNWGQKDHGVAVDLSLDRDTFALGEDVALHIALENFDADIPVYGFSPLWNPFAAVKIEVRESNGQPVKQTCNRVWTSGGPAAMWRYPKEMIVPVERSLAGDGFLPDHPGNFTVSVAWKVFRGEDDTCAACQVSDSFDFTKPYVIARSRLKSFKITNGPKPSIPCL